MLSATCASPGSFAALGVLVALVYSGAMVRHPVAAEIQGYHISYETGLAFGGAVSALYILAACGPAHHTRERVPG
ncbi:MAG: hypothetical protein ACR2HV_12005 [Acidimicrobiales bacterium]